MTGLKTLRPDEAGPLDSPFGFAQGKLGGLSPHESSAGQRLRLRSGRACVAVITESKWPSDIIDGGVAFFFDAILKEFLWRFRRPTRSGITGS